jgi:signal transduction histidine kinase
LLSKEGAIVRVPALAEGIGHLAWLPADAASLAALARAPVAAAWNTLRFDPGALLLVLRHVRATQTLPCFFPSLLHDPALFEGALQHLHSNPGMVDWTGSCAARVYRASLAYASLAQRIAERTGHCDPDNAWVAGLLAPLGWLAVCAVDPTSAALCLDDPNHAARPETVEQANWRLDQAAIARRLARRWRLPGWLTAISGHLALPVDRAVHFGADPMLFRVVQLAVGLAQRRGAGKTDSLHLPVGTDVTTAGAALGLTPEQLVALGEAVDASSLPVRRWEDAATVPLLPALLELAAENRRLREAPLLHQLESDVDELHRALVEQRAGEAQRLQEQKLTALAEFAAGAGHEINNPLAVISGQAQYLLRHGDEAGTREGALKTIIEQSQRIHQTLRDLMQFARPPRLHKQPLNVADLVREVTASLRDLAEQRQVCLDIDCPVPPAFGSGPLVEGDAAQLRTVLSCLVRNAIEAASFRSEDRGSSKPALLDPQSSSPGWVRLRLHTTDGVVEVVVEDSGAGPGLSQREHLFDPFFSGRSAGRGKGLGLPTAWRLAREHGGDVRLASSPGETTCFILRLPALPHLTPIATNHPVAC